MCKNQKISLHFSRASSPHPSAAKRKKKWKGNFWFCFAVSVSEKSTDGTTAKYVYYSCSKARDRNCKNKYIREEELIEELFKVIDKVSINELGMRIKLEEEIKRFNRLQRLATKGTPKYSINEDDVNTREYAKYVLREGTPLEKRELMGHLRSRLILKEKKITLVD